MEINFKIIVTVLSVLLTGLTAGLCFTWSNAVTPGIARLDNINFLKAFQSMNRVIINGKFLIVFMGPTILLFLNTYMFKSNNSVFWLFLIAAILYFVGVGLVTIFGNIPLNETLEQANLDKLSALELQVIRVNFEKPWNFWHSIRTLTSSISFIILIIGLIYSK